MLLRPIALAAMLIVTLPAQAGVFKCKGPAGNVIYSNEPCENVGAKKDKALNKAVLQGNQMRMRPRPAQGDGSAPEFGSGSSYQGAAPSRGGAGDPRKDQD